MNAPQFFPFERGLRSKAAVGDGQRAGRLPCCTSTAVSLGMLTTRNVDHAVATSLVPRHMAATARTCNADRTMGDLLTFPECMIVWPWTAASQLSDRNLNLDTSPPPHRLVSFISWFVGWRPRNMRVYLKDGSTLTVDYGLPH